MMIQRNLLLAIAVPVAASFTTHRVALLHPPKSSNLVLFEIDVQSVTDAVSINQTPKQFVEPKKEEAPKQIEQSTSPLPPPPPKEDEPTALTTPPASAPASPEVNLPIPELDLPIIGIAGGLFAAFAAGTFLMRGRDNEDDSPAPAPSAGGGTSSARVGDVSIPYDAAARIAYDEWRAANNKGAFDSSKFSKFKANYDKVTAENMGAKKIARDTGSSAKLQTLGPDADQ